MPPLLQEGQIVRNHRIVRRIGQGGMGEVYEAVHQTLQRRVAIKVLHPDWCKHVDLVKRFFNEALATNMVNHPAMVAIHDHGKFPDGMPFLIMEFLEGESLRRFAGQLEPLQVARLALQIATGLNAAHQKRIVHRDLKPDNIMIVRDDSLPGGQRAKILDFGLAKLASEYQNRGAEIVRTRDGVALGTPEYMSPEQWAGAARVDGKADVYSLGIVLYETLTGAPPFSSTEGDRLRSLHLYAPPPSLAAKVRDCPPELVALIEQMLGKTAAERPTMAEVGKRLEVLLLARDVSDPEDSVRAEGQQPSAESSAPKDPELPAALSSAAVQRVAVTAAAGFFIASALLLLWLLVFRGN
jgi:serine/threonine-protein kinase